MQVVQRYTCGSEFITQRVDGEDRSGGRGKMWKDPTGGYVKYEDYEALVAILNKGEYSMQVGPKVQ